MVPIMAMSQVSNTQSPVVTEAQRHHFRTFGFVAFPQLFTPAEIERYGQALERSLRRKRGGADFDGKERDVVNPMIEHDRDVFYPLLDDERLPYSTGYKSERLMETAGARRRQKIAGLAARIQEMNRS